MAFKKTFIVSDESVNTYGFWVRTEGVRLDNAKKNCPAYFNHRTWDIPLGHWENLRVENGKLLADLVIEGGNDAEKEYIRKIENGDIKGASVGLDPLAWNSEPEFLKQGQTVPTLWESELFEISLAPLNGNKNALALKGKDGLVTLSDENKAQLIPDLNTKPDMKQIALKLGLSENATEAEVLAAIIRLNAERDNAVAMQKYIEQEAAVQLDTEEKKKLFVELCGSNFSQALAFLNLNKKAETTEDTTANTAAGSGKVQKDVSLSQLIQKSKAESSKTNADDAKDCYDYLQKHNPVELARIRKEENEKYVQLTKDYQAGVRYRP